MNYQYEIGVLNDCAGSSIITRYTMEQSGNKRSIEGKEAEKFKSIQTRVMCSIDRPTEIQSNITSEIYDIQRGILSFEVSHTLERTDEKVKLRMIGLKKQLLELFSDVILLKEFPRQKINIRIQIMVDHLLLIGEYQVISCLINSVMLALIDGGFPVVSPVIGSDFVIINNAIQPIDFILNSDQIKSIGYHGTIIYDSQNLSQQKMIDVNSCGLLINATAQAGDQDFPDTTQLTKVVYNQALKIYNDIRFTVEQKYDKLINALD